MSATPVVAQPFATDDQALTLVRAAFQHARGGETAQLRASLEPGVPANVCNETGDRLLMLASYHGHAEAARLLLDRGADPELRNRRGQSPLAGAAFKGDTTMARILLDGGARSMAPGPTARLHRHPRGPVV